MMMYQTGAIIEALSSIPSNLSYGTVSSYAVSIPDKQHRRKVENNGTAR